MPLRAIYRRALSRGEVAVNPTSDLELPSVESKRDRIAPPDEAATLIAAVPQRDRALWATAFYSGLRLGELRALDWSHVDLAAGVIRVEKAWDVKEGLIEPKSKAGRRKVPIPRYYATSSTSTGYGRASGRGSCSARLPRSHSTRRPSWSAPIESGSERGSCGSRCTMLATPSPR